VITDIDKLKFVSRNVIWLLIMAMIRIY